MKSETARAIDELGETLKEYCWGIYFGSLRQVAIEGTDGHDEVKLCPLATAVMHMPAERVRELASNPESDLGEKIDAERPAIREQLEAEEPDTETSWLDENAVLYAAAMIVHDDPEYGVKSGLVTMSKEAASEIVDAAEDLETPAGQRLVRALASAALYPHLRLNKLASAVYTSRHDDPEPDFADPACT